MGARSWQVIRFLLAKFVLVVSVGLAIGMGLALAAGKALSSVVSGASSRDSLLLAAVLILLLLAAVLSGGWPALRALRLDPTVALRHALRT